MKVYIVGTGTDGSNSLTREAFGAISGSEILIGAERMVRPYASSGKRIEICYMPDEIAELLKNCGCSTASILMSGDTGFFSGTKKLLPLLKDFDTQIICGISSVSYFCTKIGLPYEEMKFISLHGRKGSIAVNVLMNRYCFFLLGGDTDFSSFCTRLCNYGLGKVTVYMGENLGYSSERILKGSAEELAETGTDRLCVAVTENPYFSDFIPSAISDSKFVRGSIPMTKSAVRGYIVSVLEVGRKSVCWDIGCGTGSVSVEMALRCVDGAVYSFDRKNEAVELTMINARKFSCDNIIAEYGECPDALKDTPPPDKVFIGGSSGSMREIFECISSKNPNADICVSAVSLETLGQVLDVFNEYGVECSIVQIAVTETRKAGSHTLLQAQNPVFVVNGRLDSEKVHDSRY